MNHRLRWPTRILSRLNKDWVDSAGFIVFRLCIHHKSSNLDLKIFFISKQQKHASKSIKTKSSRSRILQKIKFFLSPFFFIGCNHLAPLHIIRNPLIGQERDFNPYFFLWPDGLVINLFRVLGYLDNKTRSMQQLLAYISYIISSLTHAEFKSKMLLDL